MLTDFILVGHPFLETLFHGAINVREVNSNSVAIKETDICVSSESAFSTVIGAFNSPSRSFWFKEVGLLKGFFLSSCLLVIFSFGDIHGTQSNLSNCMSTKCVEEPIHFLCSWSRWNSRIISELTQ